MLGVVPGCSWGLSRVAVVDPPKYPVGVFWGTHRVKTHLAFGRYYSGFVDGKVVAPSVLRCRLVLCESVPGSACLEDRAIYSPAFYKCFRAGF